MINEENINEINLDALAHWKLDKNDLAQSINDRLFWGIEKNKRTFVEDGIKAGVQLTGVYNEQGYSPLTFAARCGSLDTLVFLLSQDLNPNELGIKEVKHNALIAAARGDHIHIINFLLSRSPYQIGDVQVELSIDMADEEKKTALHHSIQQQNFNLALKLIKQHNASLTIGDFRGRNALAVAFSCMFTSQFDSHLKPNNRIPEWEDFCIELLKLQNPFSSSAKGAASHFVAPIQVFLTTHLAVDQMKMVKEERYANPRSTHDAFIKLFMYSPMLVAMLYHEAQKNKSGQFENQFISAFEKVLKNEPDPITKMPLLTEAQVNQVKTYLRNLQNGNPLLRPSVLNPVTTRTAPPAEIKK